MLTRGLLRLVLAGCAADMAGKKDNGDTSKKAASRKARSDDKSKWPSWLHLQPKTCGQCGQSTHEFERDDPGQELHLVWIRCAADKYGTKHPTGGECYRCFDTRRKHFSNYSMEDLKIERAEHRAVDDKFTSLRAARAQGEKGNP